MKISMDMMHNGIRTYVHMCVHNKYIIHDISVSRIIHIHTFEEIEMQNSACMYIIYSLVTIETALLSYYYTAIS